MKKTRNQGCVIKQHNEIREILYKRITERNLLWKEVVADAKALGWQLHLSQLSRYFKAANQQSLSQEDILWLCKRYGVDITIQITIKRYDDKKQIAAIKRYYS